jgi:hypothetical protein
VSAWQPANETEQALLRAAADDDRRGYFQLLAAADLFLPQVVGDVPGEQRFLTVQAFDETMLPVFTSVQALAGQLGGAVDGYSVTNYAELRRKWPDPRWRLAVNPGTPVDAYLAIDGVADAAVGDAIVPTMAELILAAADEQERDQRLAQRHAAADHPADPQAGLLAAARAADVYGYVDRLLDAVVHIPTTRPAEPEEILEPGFPWRPVDGQAIEVFTSEAALRRAHPAPVPTVAVGLPFALACWPDGHGLSVNPGGDDGIELAADQVVWLLTVGP